MRSLLPDTLLSLALVTSAVAQPNNAIQRLALDPMTVVRIPVAMDRLTTVRLPSPPTDVESARVGSEPHPEALFLLSTQPGSPTFSLRALVPNTNTTINVSWKGQTYVFDLFESHQPWLSVIFEAPREPAAHPVAAASRGVSPARLIGLLDTAKAYGLLRQQHPAAVADIEVVRPDALRDYGHYTVRTEEVFRFNREDTLVFRIVISNKTSVALQFVPESLMVRVGTRFYYQSITEATGMVAAHSSTPVYFALTGGPDGSRSALSPHNDFMVFFHRIEAGTPLASEPGTPPPIRPTVQASPPPSPPVPRHGRQYFTPPSAPVPPAVAPPAASQTAVSEANSQKQPRAAPPRSVRAVSAPPVYSPPAPASRRPLRYSTSPDFRPRTAAFAPSPRPRLFADRPRQGTPALAASSCARGGGGFRIHIGFGTP